MEFIENVKVDLFFDEVYVFMFKGDIKELFVGVMLVDFVYVVYIKVGICCVVVCIDGKLVVLFILLEFGQIVKIIIVFNVIFNSGWLNFVVIGKVCFNI